MISDNIEIRKSNISGKGVFAKKLIKKGEKDLFYGWRVNEFESND
jgi:hypothetical protein